MEAVKEKKKERGAKKEEKSDRHSSSHNDRCPPKDFILVSEFFENFTPGLSKVAEFGSDLGAVDDTWRDFGDCLLNSRERAIDQLYKEMLLTGFRFYLHTRYQIERRMDKTKKNRWMDDELEMPAEVEGEMLPRLHRQQRHLRELIDDYTTHLKRLQNLEEPPDSQMEGMGGREE